MKRNKQYMIYTTEITDEYLNAIKEDYLFDEERETISEEALWEMAIEDNENWLDDEKMNLGIPTSGRIIAIADIGTWRGRRHGYQILGYNVNSIFDIFGNECYEADFYMKNGRVWADLHHHDGTNYVEFRELREDTDVDKFLDKIYNNKETQSDIYRHTKSLGRTIAKVYGW